MPITIPLVQIRPDLVGTSQELGNGCGPFQFGNNLYIACPNPVNLFPLQTWPDGTNPPVPALLHCYMSADNGLTWNEFDAAHAVPVTLTNAFTQYPSPTAAVQVSASTFLVAFTQWDYLAAHAPTLRYITFNMATGLWGAISTAGPSVPLAPNVISVQSRAVDGAVIIEWDGQLQNVGGQNYRRAFYAIYNAGWTSNSVPQSVVGTDHYRLSGGISGDGGRTHLFYTADDGASISLNCVTLNSANVQTSTVQVASQPEGRLVSVTQPWSQFLSGSTKIGVSYGKKPGAVTQFMSVATSADVPVFAETIIEPITNGSAIFALQPAGANGAAGLVAVDVGPFADIHALSNANSAWSAETLIGTYPQTVLRSVAGQPIALNSSAAFVVNSEIAVPGDLGLQVFAFAPDRCPSNAQGAF